VPALGGRIRRTAPGARAAAEDRLARALERLRRAGVRARGELGDGDPLRAIGDALGVFAADEVLVATHPEAGSAWLALDLVARARARFAVPVLHVFVHRLQGGGAGPRPVRRSAGPVAEPTLSAS
jgi:hypothetical protein